VPFALEDLVVRLSASVVAVNVAEGDVEPAVEDVAS
jgi:hypothetical protein